MANFFISLSIAFGVTSFSLYLFTLTARYNSCRILMASGVAFVGFIIAVMIAIPLASERDAAALNRATSHLKPIPSSVLISANPHATAGLVGPVENGAAIGCFKSESSLSHGWIPADFKIQSDLSISISPRSIVANGIISNDAVRYDGDNKTIVDACKAAEAASQ